ncbi:hypothetical protein [Tsuneonella sp. HG222]
MSIFFKSDLKSERPAFGVADTATKPLDRDQLRDLVSFECRKRSLRHQMFDSTVVNDSCWHVLEELYSAHLANYMPRSKAILDHEVMAPTTVLRYLDHLETFGLISRIEDPSDSRARLVKLTDKAVFWLEDYYSLLLEKNGESLRRVARSMGE